MNDKLQTAAVARIHTYPKMKMFLGSQKTTLGGNINVNANKSLVSLDSHKH